ncbi:MAG: hypothetical protein ACRDB2_05595, partial [Fusobacteriaceae bacterium]
EIADSLKPKLLPVEVEKLENHIKGELRIDDKELNWLLKLLEKVEKDKQLQKSVKKLLGN